MTKFYQSLFGFSFLLAPLCVDAAVMDYEMDPPDGAVLPEIYEIELAFDTPVSQDFDLAFGATPAAVLIGDSGEFNPVVTLSADGNGILRFYSAPTEAGEYELWVAPGLFVADNGDTSPEITAIYTLAGDEGETGGGDVTGFELDPADGSTVDALSTITIHFVDTADGIEQNYNLSGASAVKLVCGDKEYYPKAVVISGDCESGILHFDTLTEPGAYELWVAAGLFFDYETEAPSAEINATYYIKGDASDDLLADYDLDPADGSKVESLSKINIHFNGTSDGIDQNYSLSGASAAKLTCGDKEYYPLAVVISGDCESGILQFETITEPGTYELWVAQGLFVDYDTEAPSVEITATYVIDENSAVSVVVTEEAHGTQALYDLYGRKVTGTPAPGIYISGGRKIAVK